MTTNGLNTLEYAERLMRAGVPDEQAKAQALVLYEIINSTLATKRDITDVQRDIKELDVKIETIRSELKKDIEKNRAELELRIEKVRSDLGEKIEQLNTTLTVRMGLLYASSIGAILVMAKFGWLSIK